MRDSLDRSRILRYKKVVVVGVLDSVEWGKLGGEGMCKCVGRKGFVATEEIKAFRAPESSHGQFAGRGGRVALGEGGLKRLHRRWLDYSQGCLRLHGTQVAAEQFEST